jgi:hypothetical protein
MKTERSELSPMGDLRNLVETDFAYSSALRAPQTIKLYFSLD